MPKPPAAADSPSPSEPLQSEIIAAVDLGSNSFHMIVGELRHGQLAILDRIRETVRLAEGLSASGDLSDEARQRSLECLSRFGERLRNMHASCVRAAGTSTIRLAREDTSFMSEAEALLGHPIEVISGIEEARLVYKGVTHSLPPTDGMRLVVDIGGGSTEIILGEAAVPRALESLHLGCVSMSERFFPGGRITTEGFAAARMAARLELRPVKSYFRNVQELESIGASGTIRATERVAQALGLEDTGLTLAAIESMIDKVLTFESTSKLSLQGLSERRAQVWPGGLAILAELFIALRIRHMGVSDGALREGLLYDLLGRLQHEDARERTVQSMASRYNVDAEQAQRVARSAAELLDDCAVAWGLESELAALGLDWAARLHEIGLDISHNGYQRHGAYIAEYADMPGFPRAEQRFLAFLIGSQRDAIDTARLAQLPRSWRQPALRLAALLRLAVLLNRSRNPVPHPPAEVEAADETLAIHFDPEWLALNPLTIADLDRERAYLADVGYRLELR